MPMSQSSFEDILIAIVGATDEQGKSIHVPFAEILTPEYLARVPKTIQEVWSNFKPNPQP